jgi:hypothetical protein
MIFSFYNEEKSAAFTGRILLELRYNPRIKNDFGEFIPGDKPSLRRFTVNVPGSGGRTVLVRSISIGQEPHGFVHGPHRPDYVRMDDIQSRKCARSQKFVLESVDWIIQDLIPVLTEGYSTVMVATPLNTQCVTNTLEKGPTKSTRLKRTNTLQRNRGSRYGKTIFLYPGLPSSRRLSVYGVCTGVSAHSGYAGRADIQRGIHKRV